MSTETKAYKVTHSEAEWRKLLTPEQYAVMRGHGTERPGSCALLHEKRPGSFACAGCGTTLFEGQVQVRERHGVAELQRAGGGVGGDDDGPQLRDGADRGALRHLRQPPRARLPGRAAADGPALLHQRGGAGLPAGADGGQLVEAGDLGGERVGEAGVLGAHGDRGLVGEAEASGRDAEERVRGRAGWRATLRAE